MGRCGGGNKLLAAGWVGEFWDHFLMAHNQGATLFCMYPADTTNPRPKEGPGMSLALISSSGSLSTFFLLSHLLGLKWGFLAATPKTPRRRGLFFPVLCQFGHSCTQVTSAQIWETESEIQTLPKIFWSNPILRYLQWETHMFHFLYLCSHVYTWNGKSLWESHFSVHFILLFPAVRIIAGRRKAGYPTGWCESLSGEWCGCVCLYRASEILCGSENVFQSVFLFTVLRQHWGDMRRIVLGIYD